MIGRTNCRVLGSLFLTFVWAAPLGAQAPSQSPGASNLFCGPQSVQRILQYYGQDSSLGVLVREVQWPDYRNGSTLASLGKALERRGIHTRAVSVPVHTDLAWEFPMILHRMDAEQQHYVVWIPPDSAGGRPQVWDPTIPPTREAKDPLRHRSDVVLLTSREPIPAMPVVGSVSQTSVWNHVVIALGMGSGGVFLGYFLWPRGRRAFRS